MKKLLLTSILILTLLTITQAQQYYPLLDSVNIWTYITPEIGVRIDSTAPPPFYPIMNDGPFKVYTTTDTVIHSFNYKKVHYTLFGDTLLYGYLREDTSAQKVYFQDILDSPEVLLYNFSMQIGDSMHVSFIDSGGYFKNGTYYLDSINTFTIHAGVRRAFYLNDTVRYNHTLIWIEGVGNLGDAIYPYTINEYGGEFGNCPGYPHEFFQIMSCFEHNQLIYYDSCALETALNDPENFFYYDTCDYTNKPGGVADLSSSLSFNVSPNPSTKQITIHTSSFQTNEEVMVSIINVLGQEVLTPSLLQRAGEDATVNISTLPTGLYFLQMKTESTRVVRMFVKE